MIIIVIIFIEIANNNTLSGIKKYVFESLSH